MIRTIILAIVLSVAGTIIAQIVTGRTEWSDLRFPIEFDPPDYGPETEIEVQ